MRCGFVLVLLCMCMTEIEAFVDSFGHCSTFFYKGTPPQGLNNAALQTYYYPICQMYKEKVHFATLYIPELRIPMFSAYRLDVFKCNGVQNSRMNQWFIEPQLSLKEEMRPILDMKKEDEYYLDWSINQAVNGDYRNTNYDRGHLNPSFYQCDDARTATFTLTNAVPQDPCFNRQKWFEMEKMSKQIMKDECNVPGAQRFFVTGVIPSDTSIPSSEHDKEGDQNRAYNRVNVAYAMWTAACCASPNDQDSFSFSYVGLNKPDSFVDVISIPDLLWLLERYRFYNVQIFANHCFPYNKGSDKALKTLGNVINARTSAGINRHPSLLTKSLFHYNQDLK